MIIEKKIFKNACLPLFCILFLLSVVSCDKNNDDEPVHNIATVKINGGSFIMGSPDTEPTRNSNEIQREVTVSGFSMSKYEVTNKQFADFLNVKGIGADGLATSGDYAGTKLADNSHTPENWGLEYSGNKWIPVAGFEDHPVIFVSWYGACEFCKYVGGRLPTEAEWEYACRAGTTTPFNTGDCFVDSQGNFNYETPYPGCTNTVTTYPEHTMAVGQFSSNAFNLHDMHGNVWEWVADWFGDYQPDSQNNPTGPASGTSKVLRGGGWTNYAQQCRSANRFSYLPEAYSQYVGFRVAFDL
jgi:formylglycine-generating enzyme required for sulfatase activity